MKNKFDQVWIDNRFRYRAGMSGTALRTDEVTGYMEPITIRGFSAEMKETFIKRFTVCSNMAAICRSINIDTAAVYDAIALDPKFRTDFIRCYYSTGRKKQLNNQLVILADSAKQQVITELTSKLSKYTSKTDPYSPEHYK